MAVQEKEAFTKGPTHNPSSEKNQIAKSFLLIMSVILSILQAN